MNKYIYGVDCLIDIDDEKNDRQLWKLYCQRNTRGGKECCMVGGTFEFTFASFSGDFSGANDHWVGDKHQPLNLVEKGTTIAYPLSNAKPFDGRTTNYSITMTEAVWRKGPQNML